LPSFFDDDETDALEIYLKDSYSFLTLSDSYLTVQPDSEVLS